MNTETTTTMTRSELAKQAATALDQLLKGSVNGDDGNDVGELPIGDLALLQKSLAEIKYTMNSMWVVSEEARMDIDWGWTFHGNCGPVVSFVSDKGWIDDYKLVAKRTGQEDSD